MDNEVNTTAVQPDEAEQPNSNILAADPTITDQGEQNPEGEQPTGEEAGGDDQASPETYSDFTLPEGVELDEKLMNEVKPLFEEVGMTKDQAQKFVDLHAKVVQEGARQQAEQFSELVNGWQKQAKADKEFGGDKFDENVGVARSAVDKLGTPEFKQLMEDHGVGNHPEMIRFMWNVGKLMKEDTPGQSGGPSTPQKDRVSILYPND